ncbi:MAG: tetratricopeptide (TPR) repeat protein [Crocinitomix sp.]|jgi:tetratricopeptide (TPR) repeat protein
MHLVCVTRVVGSSIRIIMTDLIEKLKQNIWDERFYNLYPHKITCLDNAIEKILAYQKENEPNESLEEVKVAGLKKLLVYRIENKKPYDVQLKNNLAALEKEWDEGEKDRIRTRILHNYIFVRDAENAFKLGMKLLEWGHVDVWWLINYSIELGDLSTDQSCDIQDQFFKHFRNFKDNKYLWNSLGPVYSLNPERVTLEIVNEFFEISNSEEVDEKNVHWNRIGIFYFEKNAFEQAIKCYQKAKDNLKLDAEDYLESVVIYEGNIAEAFLELNNYKVALEYADKCLAIEPENLTLIKYRFHALFKGGEPDKAREYLGAVCNEYRGYAEELRGLADL